MARLLICKFCHKEFIGDPRRKYCYSDECAEKRRLEKLEYAKEYNKKYKKRNRGTPNHKKEKFKPIITKIPCLKCGRNFPSEGIHNRICDKCRITNSNLGEHEKRYEVWL